MDFVIDLLESKDFSGQVYTNIIVIIDRLRKGVIAGVLSDLQVKTVTNWFFYCYYLYYFLSRLIVLDQGA
jgi:hypothetical protein